MENCHMKIDNSRPQAVIGSERLPVGIVDPPPTLPFEAGGFGQFRDYREWRGHDMRVVCADGCKPVRRVGAAGHQLFARDATVVPGNGSVLVDTGVSVKLRAGHYGKIEGCTLLGMDGILPFGGVVDEDYSGKITVKLFNMQEAPYIIAKGAVIAQLVVARYAKPNILCVERL